MIKEMFSVYDSKAKVFSDVFLFPNRAVAIRNFTQTAKQEGEVSKYPMDFSIVFVGIFDDSNGAIEPNSPVENLGTAEQFLASGDAAVPAFAQIPDSGVMEGK